MCVFRCQGEAERSERMKGERMRGGGARSGRVRGEKGMLRSR